SFSYNAPIPTVIYTLSLHDALPICHRYEFNREYEALLTGGGLQISGSTPDSTYVEIVEIPGHPYFLGCQFHPEFKSKPLEPHPLDRKSTRLNSSHLGISYAVFCLKK